MILRPTYFTDSKAFHTVYYFHAYCLLIVLIFSVYLKRFFSKGTCSLFDKIPRPGDSRETSFGLRVQLLPVLYLSNYSKVEASHVKYLAHCPRTQQANLPAWSTRYPCNAERQEQGSCEYQLFKYFGVIKLISTDSMLQQKCNG